MIWLLRRINRRPTEFAPAMDEGTGILPGLPPVAGKPVHLAFDGGRMTSDAGILLLAALEQRLGIAERLADCIEDRAVPARHAPHVIRYHRARPAPAAPTTPTMTSALQLRRLRRCRPARTRRPRQHPPTAKKRRTLLLHVWMRSRRTQSRVNSGWKPADLPEELSGRDPVICPH